MKKDLLKDYFELSNFLVRNDFYRSQYAKGVSKKLYDFLIIILWKTFILFSYEKIQQTRHIVSKDKFKIDYWEKKGLKEKKHELSNYPIDNVFSYNEIEDEKIIDLLKRIYEFDENFSKKLKALKTDRNTSAHVAEKTLFSTEIQINNATSFLLKAVKNIDNKYKNKFLKTIKLKETVWEKISYSKTDFKFILNIKILLELKKANSFDSAKDIMKFIERFVDYLDIECIEKILTTSFENKGTYNQVIDGSYGYSFFNFLLDRTYEIKGNLNKWKLFYEQLNDDQKYRYLNIKDSLNKQGIFFEKDEEEIDINSILF
jgi:hypothetical protein